MTNTSKDLFTYCPIEAFRCFGRLSSIVIVVLFAMLTRTVHGEDEMTTATSNTVDLQKRIHDLEKEIKRLTLKIKNDKWGLNWIDCPEAFDAECENKIPVLEEVAQKAIKQEDGKPTHFLIEGDNYHVLQCLNFTHRGKVDVIYIDPPYNTGSDGFTYKDKRFLEKYPSGERIDKSHPLRHSAWLSFMEKRLRLAKNLMHDSGVIFMSINEDEYANLKLLSDLIFGESNYVTTFVIKVRHEDRILKGDKPIHEVTEFLLMYRRTMQYQIQKRKVDNSDPSEYCYQIKEKIQSPRKVEMGGKMVEIFSPNEYEIVKSSPSFNNLKKINIRGSIKSGNSSGRFHMTYLEPLKNNFSVLYKVPGIGDDGLGYRYFLSRASKKKANGFYFQGAPLNREDIREIPYPNYWDLESEFNEVGTEGGVVFDGGKKPITFIQKILKVATDKKDCVVLDFFAGSGSTMHAVADLNRDGGLRRSILVQCADLTYEMKNGCKKALKGSENAFNAGYERVVDITFHRAENIMKGYIGSQGECHSPLGGSLKYYRTSFVGKRGSEAALDEDRRELAAKAGCLLSMAEDTLETEKVNAKEARYWQHYSYAAHRHTLVYYSQDYLHFNTLSETADVIREKDASARITVYVYASGSVDVFENEFDDMKGITLKPIPEPILEIYKVINAR